MPREKKESRRARAVQVIQTLDVSMPEAKIELDYRKPFELLVSVMLSAQCTDKRVNMVTPLLFQKFPDVQAYARSTPAELEPYIRTCGLFRSKAKNIIGAARTLVQKHGGKVPVARADLEALPGVGRKSAGVVSIHLGGGDALPVDTHIRRLSRRLGFSTHDDPDKVELDLCALLPARLWAKAHQLFIWHGRRTCFARNPACDRCVVNELCPKIGVKKRRAPAERQRRVALLTPRARPSAASSASG